MNQLLTAVDVPSGRVHYGPERTGEVRNIYASPVGAANRVYITDRRGATLVGNGPDVLTKVSRVGHDLKLDHGVGICGKEGQSVPVGVGIPTIKVDQLTVGGTALTSGSSFQG